MIPTTNTAPDSMTNPPLQPSPLWLDQLAQELLLTAQAFQALQTALTAKFK